MIPLVSCKGLAVDLTIQSNYMAMYNSTNNTRMVFTVNAMWCTYSFLLTHSSQDAFDRMAVKVEDARARWEMESSEIQEKNKQLLLEFGLNPLEI